jgi:hypothetical protein
LRRSVDVPPCALGERLVINARFLRFVGRDGEKSRNWTSCRQSFCLHEVLAEFDHSEEIAAGIPRWSGFGDLVKALSPARNDTGRDKQGAAKLRPVYSCYEPRFQHVGEDL